MADKYDDDITLTETLERKEACTLPLSLDYVLSWSADNPISINQKKTKEIQLDPIKNSN